MRLPPAHLGVLLLLAGCSNDFAPYSQLDRLRVLGIQAEPATPLPGETTVLSALVFAPAGEAVAYRWTWCPASAPAGSGYACPLDEAQAGQAFAATLDLAVGTALPSLELGSAATASFSNPFSLSALAGLCAAGLDSPIYAQSFDCEGGFPVTIVLDVSTTAAALRAGFVLRLPVGDAPELNHNPAPAGLQFAGAGAADPPSVIRIVPSQTIDLHLDIPGAAVETRSIPPSEGAPGQRPERLVASWFADSGEIDVARTSFIGGETSLEPIAHNRWTAPSAAAWPASGVVEFAVVLRDDRSGVGWLVRQVSLEPGP
jgi:hypothetical protein